MRPTATALRRGWARGLIELRQSFTGAGLLGHLFWPVVTLVLPSVLGMFIALGMLLMVQYLTAEREDGTLLRAKAVPNGIGGYFIGKLVTVSGTILAYLVILLLPGLLIIDGLGIGSIGSWLTLAWVLLLGLVAILSLGAMLGSPISSPRGAGYLSLQVMGLIAISGIFYPVTALRGWLQGIAQVFPMYWLGLGMRSALLPDAAVFVELGRSWRHLETIGVLGTWAVLGLIVAPIVLRRMARRESGSMWPSAARRRCSGSDEAPTTASPSSRTLAHHAPRG
jgi:ABC-2 type transport system permease protein